VHNLIDVPQKIGERNLSCAKFSIEAKKEEIFKNGDHKPKKEATGLELVSGQVCIFQI